jgi:hypothetical protein
MLCAQRMMMSWASWRLSTKQSFVELHSFIWDYLDFSECVCYCAMMQRFDPDISFKLPGNELGVQMCQVTNLRAFFIFFKAFLTRCSIISGRTFRKARGHQTPRQEWW